MFELDVVHYAILELAVYIVVFDKDNNLIIILLLLKLKSTWTIIYINSVI